MDNKKMWIVSTPFNRRQYSSMTNGFVDYSGALYNNNGRNLTFDEYMSDPERAARYENPRIISDDEMWKLWEESENDMKTMFSEVTAEAYEDALECLPPKKWHNITKDVNIFFLGECYTGSLYSCYLLDRTTGKHYCALRSIFETDEEILNIYNQSNK